MNTRDAGAPGPLLNNPDPQVWAREWCRIAKDIEAADDDREVIDEGWMIGWFANAMEVGRINGLPEDPNV